MREAPPPRPEGVGVLPPALLTNNHMMAIAILMGMTHARESAIRKLH